MIRRHLTYANVTSTLALCLAIGAGSAYAVDHIGSSDVKNNSLRSDDLRNGIGVKGKDVKKNTLTGKEIQEQKLDASGIAVASGAQNGGCSPAPSVSEECVSKKIDVRQRSRLIVIATGDQLGDGVASSATCGIEVDGVGNVFVSHPGEVTNNTNASATNGFARTYVSEPLDKRSHQVALVCSRNGANAVRIDNPTLAIIAIGSQ